MISVIIPTFNEEKNISSLLDHLVDCDSFEKIEIIICDSPNSNDKGYEIACKKKVKTLKSPMASRANQMNYAAQFAEYNILHFLHADTRPPKNFIQSIKASIDEGNDFGNFSYKFDSNRILLRMNAFFTKFDSVFAGGGDQSLFIRKAIFEKLGGFNDTLGIMEDFDFYKRAKKAGYRYETIDNPLLVSCRKYNYNSWLKVNFTNLRIYILYLLNARQEKLIKLYEKLKD